ncbi:TlpA family protein disulfide reductase [Mucilaginibacter calamicampi]|uniref:TlpA family protein disulfide reductase n=1 Tax=Mucilaginibacter calamicampi TaxID=1302352 RepID=A0ABW2YZR0_9SPHI
MKKLSLLLTAVLLIAYSTAWSQAMKPVIITGNIINGTEQTPKVIKFNFLNPLINESPSIEVTGTEKFSVQQDMLYTHNMTVNYANYFINLLVKPGDSVHLTIDAALLDQPKFAWLKISGDGANIKTQLNLCANYIYQLKTHDYNMELPPNEMEAMIKQDYARYLTALNTYAAENNLDPLVVNWAKKDIKYLISNTISDYPREKNLSDQQKRARLNIFSGPFFDMYNAENFQSMMFPYHLDNYFYQFKDLDKTIAVKENMPATDMMKKILVQGVKLPIGECRDYMIFHRLKELAAKYPEVLKSFKNANKYFSTAIYNQQLQKLALGGKNPVFPAVKISGIQYLNGKSGSVPVNRTNVFSYLAAKYPGKVLYVDVYATWCGPCIEEMKSAPDMYQAMQGKDVVFVNLCLQSTAANWTKFVKEKNVEGENYFFTGDASKLFMSTYKLPGYPSYVLVNKQGEIATTDAPRPSEKKRLVAAVDELLKK